MSHARALSWIVMVLLIPGSLIAGDCGSMSRYEKVTVQLTVDDGEVTAIAVDRDPVTIYLDDSGTKALRVCWVAPNLPDGHKVKVAVKKGKDDIFAKSHKSSGVKKVTPASPYAGSGTAKRTGEWIYDVWVEKDGREVRRLDPRVIVKGGG